MERRTDKRLRHCLSSQPRPVLYVSVLASTRPCSLPMVDVSALLTRPRGAEEHVLVPEGSGKLLGVSRPQIRRFFHLRSASATSRIRGCGVLLSLEGPWHLDRHLRHCTSWSGREYKYQRLDTGCPAVDNLRFLTRKSCEYMDL